MGNTNQFRFWLTDRPGSHPLVRISYRGEMVLCSLQPASGGERHWLRGEYGEAPDAIAERCADAAAEAIEGNWTHVRECAGWDDNEDAAVAALEQAAGQEAA